VFTGLFAIANATELAYGRDSLLYLIMHERLLRCIERGRMEPFSLMRSSIPVGNRCKKLIVEDIHVHVECQMTLIQQ